MMQYDPYSVGTKSNVSYGKTNDTEYTDNIIKLFPITSSQNSPLNNTVKVQRLERIKIMKFIFLNVGKSYSYLDEKVIGYTSQGQKFYEVKFTLSDRNVARVTNLLVRVVKTESENLHIYNAQIVSPEMMKNLEPKEEGPVKDTVANYLNDHEYRS
ncbi:uncharacterized protein METZ01_LOCUS401283 [marine metagenome]|uniref:Uncharacterized protein n=1 Tax=marine metagenome TaxID=408172 RepID=A0A382VPF1_9ZZZZ